MTHRPRTLLAWSSGKDSAWTLHLLRQQGQVEVCGLLTTFNGAAERVAMHAVRRELVAAQAAAADLPLWTVDLPFPCTNDDYERRMAAAMQRARAEDVTAVAFGDLFLQDIRDYRVRQMAGTGIEPIFPLWGAATDTPALARRMLAGGLRAVLTCVDTARLEPRFAGRDFDEALLAELSARPAAVDPCGENGEFHTFCRAGPMFARAIPVRVGETLVRDGFAYADLLPERPAD